MKKVKLTTVLFIILIVCIAFLVFTMTGNVELHDRLLQDQIQNQFKLF